MTVYDRDTHSEAQRGVAAYTKNLTWVGSGGIDTAQGPVKHGATTIITHNLVTNAALGNSVDGKVVNFSYFHTAQGTDTATAMHTRGSTLVSWGPMPRAGSIVAISGFVTAALAATDHVTFSVVIGATASTVAKLSMTQTSAAYVQFAKDLIPFAAGKKIGVNYACAHFGATAVRTMLVNVLVEI
jgi:hypothetical protein